MNSSHGRFHLFWDIIPHTHLTFKTHIRRRVPYAISLRGSRGLPHISKTSPFQRSFVIFLVRYSFSTVNPWVSSLMLSWSVYCGNTRRRVGDGRDLIRCTTFLTLSFSPFRSLLYHLLVQCNMGKGEQVTTTRRQRSGFFSSTLFENILNSDTVRFYMVGPYNW